MEVVDHFTTNNKHLYVYTKAKESRIEYDVYVSEKEEKLVNGMLVYYSYNSLNVIMWVLFTLSTIIFVITIFVGRGDDDFGWSSNDCFNDALKWFVKCDKIDGKYYQYAFNRLLCEDHYRSSNFGVRSLSELRTLPTYHSKTEVRDKLLKKMGI